ncbi:UNVERIFIED_CONTAM: hypothetical protein FKN15_024300 [Acipenser sinensis]
MSKQGVRVGVAGNSRESLQQDVERDGRLRCHVLWAGLRHYQSDAHHQVRMQVPVVLLRQVQRLRGDCGRTHLQGIEEDPCGFL